MGNRRGIHLPKMFEVMVGAKRALIGSKHIEAKYCSHIILILQLFLAATRLREIADIQTNCLERFLSFYVFRFPRDREF